MTAASKSPADRRHIRLGSQVKVEMSDGEWLPATFLGVRSSDAGEEFDYRYDVRLADGRRLQGCHPQHVELA